MPGMAFQYAANGQPASLDGASFKYCDSCVFRARRIETALVTNPGREYELINTNQSDKEIFHDAVRSRRSVNSLRIVESVLPQQSPRNLTTTSICPRSFRRLRNISRIIRRSRARSTARAACLRPITMPNRAPPCVEPPDRTINRNFSLRNRRGNVPVNCDAPRKRTVRGNVARAAFTR